MSEEKKQQPYSMMGAGIAIGVGIGTAIGIAMDNLAIGMSIGIAIGIIFGVAFDAQRRSGPSNGESLDDTEEPKG